MTTQDDRVAFEKWYHKSYKNSGQLWHYNLLIDVWQAALAHERQLKPVQVDDVKANAFRKLAIAKEALLQASRHLDLLAPNSIPTKMVSEALFKLKDNAIPAISNTVEAIGYWVKEPTVEENWYFSLDKPNNPLFIYKPLFTAPPQSQSVKDAFEAAAKIAELMPLKAVHPHEYRSSDDSKAISWDISHHIRKLITDKKEC